MRNTFWVTHGAGFYFRVMGYGLAIDRDMRRGFSERNGYQKVYRLGRWALQLLKPSN